MCSACASAVLMGISAKPSINKIITHFTDLTLHYDPYGLRTTYYRLQTTNYKPQITNYELPKYPPNLEFCCGFETL